MSLESSHEHKEHEQLTSAKIVHIPDVQGDNRAEQLPANVTPTLAPLDSNELVALLLSWIRTPDWSTSQIYLQTHPQLLTEIAEHRLEELKRAQENEQAQGVINLHQILLQKARVEGIEAAYKHFLVPEPETLLSGQEVETYQALQDPATLTDAGMAALRQY